VATAETASISWRAGHVSAAIGIDELMRLAVAVFLAATTIIFSIRSVSAIRARFGEGGSAPTIPAA